MYFKMSFNAGCHFATIPHGKSFRLHVDRLLRTNHIFAITLCRVYAQQSTLTHCELSTLFNNRNAFSLKKMVALISIRFIKVSQIIHRTLSRISLTQCLVFIINHHMRRGKPISNIMALLDQNELHYQCFNVMFYIYWHEWKTLLIYVLSSGYF